MTTPIIVVVHNNMKARLIEKSRTVISDTSFFEVVLWHLPSPVPGSKYRLTLIVNGDCVLRYDNERGKGDHRRMGDREEAIEFTSLDALFDAFRTEMERMLR